MTDPLAANHDIILFDNAGVGGSTGKVPTTMAGMAEHAAAFLDAFGIATCDVLGFSLGGVIAQQMALDSSKVFRKMILVGTAPRGGEDIMHLEKLSLAKFLHDTTLKGYEVLAKDFLSTDGDEPSGWQGIHRTPLAAFPRSGPNSGARGSASTDRRISRVGRIFRESIR